MTTKTHLKLAALGDIHYGSSANHPLPPFAEIAEGADVLLLCGDLTDHGYSEQAQGLLKELLVVKIPIIAVLGNHDYESGNEAEVQKILCDGGIKVLNGEACEVQGVGFAGAKGFAGGFGRRTLEPWGEKIVKAFVQEAVDEALKLESALSRLRTEHRIAVLHYAPIAATVEGEPIDLFPFLGCSRLEEPLNRYRVTAAFHGHAHRGAPEGKTTSGIPVYNVSLPILRKEFTNQPPVRRFEIDLEQPGEP